jgi:hypothetical protein
MQIQKAATAVADASPIPVLVDRQSGERAPQSSNRLNERESSGATLSGIDKILSPITGVFLTVAQ